MSKKAANSFVFSERVILADFEVQSNDTRLSLEELAAHLEQLFGLEIKGAVSVRGSRYRISLEAQASRDNSPTLKKLATFLQDIVHLKTSGHIDLPALSELQVFLDELRTAKPVATKTESAPVAELRYYRKGEMYAVYIVVPDQKLVSVIKATLTKRKFIDAGSQGSELDFLLLLRPSSIDGVLNATRKALRGEHVYIEERVMTLAEVQPLIRKAINEFPDTIQNAGKTAFLQRVFALD